MWNTLEVTVSYKAWARLTPTLTHIVTYELVTSGAEDKAMSMGEYGYGLMERLSSTLFIISCKADCGYGKAMGN